MAKRPKSADTEPDKSSHEEERALAQLLALLDGRGEFDWPEDRRAEKKSR